MAWLDNADDLAKADEAAAFNENFFCYLTEVEHISEEEAYRIVYGD